MRILAIDVGTGTQDILLFESGRTIENCCKLVMPSPTAAVAERVKAATARGAPLLLTGVTMGGGPSHWAAEAHIRAGCPVYATPDAARSFNDDLAEIEGMGIRVVADDEARRLAAESGVAHVELRDVDLDAIRRALAAFGVPGDFDALAVAVFDHGNSPPGYSDRAFRFDYLRETVRRTPRLEAFAFPAEAVPPSLTRMLAVAATVGGEGPLVLMDTGPAAVLGALDDPHVRAARNAVAVNVGNFHTLAFHLDAGAERANDSGEGAPRIVRIFEHHTGLLDPAKLDGILDRFATGRLTNAEIFADSGHGALDADPALPPPELWAATGPRRAMLATSRHAPYLAVPHGDMMLAGCFGLLRATAHHLPETRGAIEAALGTPQPAARA